MKPVKPYVKLTPVDRVIPHWLEWLERFGILGKRVGLGVAAVAVWRPLMAAWDAWLARTPL